MLPNLQGQLHTIQHHLMQSLALKTPWCTCMSLTGWLVTSRWTCSPHKGSTKHQHVRHTTPMLTKNPRFVTGLSQLPSQVPNSVSGSLQYYCNDMPIPAFTQSQTPTHPSGQPVTENPSSDCVIRPPSTLSQQLSNSFPSIHPYFNSHHTSSAGHTQQLGSASPSFTDILNADCFPAWTAPANEPGSSP